ncbi:MAG: O-antigen ligase family protein [Nitrospiraceae bacterium]
MQSKAGDLALALALAIPMALLLSLTKPTMGLALAVGAVVLLVAFLSTTASLYILIASMLLGPEFLVGGLGGGGGASGRGITLRFDDFLIVVMGLGWFARVAVHKEGAGITANPLNRWIALYISASILATLIGVMQGRVVPQTGFFFLLKYYEYVFIYFMVLNAVTSSKQTKEMIGAILVVCFLISLFAISQIPSGERASAPFEGETGEPNTLGGYLVFMLAVVMGFLLTPGAVSNRIPLVVLFGAGSVGLLATLSRTSFLAAGVVGLAVFGLLAARRSLWLPVTLAVCVGGVAAMPAPVKERVMYTFTQAHEEGQIEFGKVRVDTSTSERLRSWQQSLTLFRQHPLFGAGVTGAPFMDAMYPRILSETGLIGMAAFLAMLWGVAKIGMRSYRSAVDPFQKALALGFLLGFLGLLVHAVGANTFMIVRIMEPFWLYAALVVRGYLHAQNRLEGGHATPQPGVEERPAAAWGSIRV